MTATPTIAVAENLRAKYAANVFCGAQFLDANESGWFRSIDKERLSFPSFQDCVLGQLHGAYDRALRIYEKDGVWGREYGFTLNGADFCGSEEVQQGWDLLVELWKAAIDQRLENFAHVTEKYAPRVALGAAFLDEVEPGWHVRVNKDRLAFPSMTDCVIGQLRETYHTGLVDYGKTTLWGVENGFSLEEVDFSGNDHDPRWLGLTDLWLAEIGKRETDAAV